MDDPQPGPVFDTVLVAEPVAAPNFVTAPVAAPERTPGGTLR